MSCRIERKKPGAAFADDPAVKEKRIRASVTIVPDDEPRLEDAVATAQERFTKV